MAKGSDQVLAPAVTNFDRRPLKKMLYFFDDQSNQRVLYNTFDVTSLVQKAENTVGVLLGNAGITSVTGRWKVVCGTIHPAVMPVGDRIH